jgi:hypothetical protein
MQTLMQNNSDLISIQEPSTMPEIDDRSQGLNWLLTPLTPEEEVARVKYLKPGGERLREGLCSASSAYKDVFDFRTRSRRLSRTEISRKVGLES